MSITTSTLAMKGHLDIWTTMVDGHITQSMDFDDALIEIGRAVITGGKRVTLFDAGKQMLDVQIHVEDVEK